MKVRWKTFLLLISPLLLGLAAAYIQWGITGLPSLPVPALISGEAAQRWFPAWLRVGHYINFLFLTLLIRSGLQILMDHPRLYWNVHCTPGTEFLRFTPVEVPKATAIVFYSFGEGADEYYDSLSIENALHPQTLLAYEMNSQPLQHLHGAPLRLRVENQLGFKMVKWIKAIEFVANIRTIKQGEGGYAEDNEYFGELANI